MLPCASLAPFKHPRDAAVVLLLEHTPFDVVCLHADTVATGGDCTTTDSIIECIQQMCLHASGSGEWVGSREVANLELSTSLPELVMRRKSLSMILEYDIVPSADGSRWHYTIDVSCSDPQPRESYHLFTREIDILREAMYQEGNQFPNDPPGDALCRVSGTSTIKLDVLYPTSDLLRLGRRLLRR
jgi:hypothetical protein